jgi:serine/threonine-protein kinase
MSRAKANPPPIRTALLVVSAIVCALPARAQNAPPDSAAAQALFDQAKRLMNEGKFQEACPKLEESQRLDPASGTLLNLADCYEHQGRTATAWSKFLEAAAAARASNKLERERVARDRASAIVSKVPNIVITVTASDATPDLEVKRDGTRVGQAQWGSPIAADPGLHEISASAPGRSTWHTSINLEPNGRTSTVVVPELAQAANAGPAPVNPVVETAPPPTQAIAPSDVSSSPAGQGGRTMRTAGFVTAGAGVLGAGVGTFFLIRSASKRSDANDLCGSASQTCMTEERAQVDQLDRQANQAKTAGITTLLVGAAAIGVGVSLVVLGSKGESPKVALSIAPGAVRLGGTF